VITAFPDFSVPSDKRGYSGNAVVYYDGMIKQMSREVQRSMVGSWDSYQGNTK
jgi:hypothetical protein